MIRTDDVGQCFSRRQWLGASAFKIEIELSVRVTWFELFDELKCQRSFADATHALQTRDGDAALLDCRKQLSLLVHATGKVSRWWWNLVESRRACSLIDVDVLVTGDIIAAELIADDIFIVGNNRAAFDLTANRNAAFGTCVDA